MSYAEFLARKQRKAGVMRADDPAMLADSFDYQRSIVRWAHRKGRAAIFADTGLGKTRMQLDWARNVDGDVLILAPLCVGAQTVREAANLGIHATLCRSAEDVRSGINVTNYDRLHLFDTGAFRGVVLDESSIIKHHTSKTLESMMSAFAGTPYRLCCTATPAPNDHTEIGTHAEFLGVCKRSEMLAEYFFHDGGDTAKWTLKRHAESAFWKWVSSWAVAVRRPADLGDDRPYALPKLTTHIVDVRVELPPAQGCLFSLPARTLTERRAVRRDSISARVMRAAELVASQPHEPWVVWCELNDEADALEQAIDGAIGVGGSDTTEDKEARLNGFAQGSIRVLITKPSVAGFGLNWQHCARMVFVGMSDSYEQYYQAVRRCWRYGQTREVEVYVIATDHDRNVRANVARKMDDDSRMRDALVSLAKETVNV